MLRPCTFHCGLTGVFLLAFGASAEITPPVIITDVQIEVTANTTVNPEPSFPGGPFSLESDEDARSAMGSAASVELDLSSTQNLASSAAANIASDVYADEFVVRVDAVSEARAGVGSGEEARAAANVSAAISFMVTEPTSVQIVGAFELFPDGGDLLGTTGVQSGGNVQIIGINPANPFDFFSFQDSVGFLDPAQRRETSFSQIAELQPMVMYTLSVAYIVGAGADINGGVSNADARGVFSFRLHFGDRDGDGLLDTWEKNGGIDVDGDSSIDIALPGANPDRKNIYVEVDRYAGSPFDPGFVGLVENAFANAPGAFIGNADGSDGIIFNALIDEVISSTPNYPNFPDESLSAAAAAVSEQFRGRAQDRNASNSDDLLEVWSRVYRHCVWGGSIGPLASGWGEVGGDQFIVTTDPFTTFPQPSFGASVFFHELGHNLGLLHGGGDSMNRKPNYFSSMNIVQAFPGAYFKIDFSPVDLGPLNENMLDESLGLGPVPASLQGRTFAFNAAEAGQPRDRQELIAGVPIDWDGDGMIGIATNRDLNAGPRSGSPGETLYGFNDWDNIFVPIRGGDGNFGFNPGERGTGGYNTGGGRTTDIYEEELPPFAARFYQTNVCEPDFDVDGSATFFDALVYLQLFDADSSRADRDDNDTLDEVDVESFIGDLEAGCP